LADGVASKILLYRIKLQLLEKQISHRSLGNQSELIFYKEGGDAQSVSSALVLVENVLENPEQAFQRIQCLEASPTPQGGSEHLG